MRNYAILRSLCTIAVCIAGVCAFGAQAFAYTTDGLLVSKNMIESEGGARRIISFTYTASSIPANTTLQVQFSQFSGTGSTKWYNSSGTRHGWDTMTSGTHTIDLTGLHWSGTKFYYRVRFTSSDGVNTPVLDSVSIDFDSNVGRYDTYNSTGALVSANLLPAVSVDNMSGVTLTVSVLPTQTNLAIQFSQNGTSWYSAAGVLNASTALGEGGNSMDLSGLGWSGRQFYYRVNYASSGATTAVLDDLGLVLDTGTGTVQYVGTGTYAGLTLGDSYYNLAFSGTGIWTLDAALDVNRAFSLTHGTFRQGAYAMNVAGDMRIAAGTTFTKSTNGSRLILDGDLTLENEAGANLGHVQIGASPDTITLSGSLIADRLTIGSGDTLVTNGFDVIVGTGGITNSGTIIASGGIGGTTSISTASGFVNHGTYTSGDSVLTLSGSFINKGTFTANTGSVILDGANQTLSGSTIFYNLTKTVTSTATLTLSASDTFTIGNTLTLQGAAGNLLSLRSSTSGTQWKINPQGTRTIGYLDVKDSNNTNATAIDATGGTNTDSGNNTNWTFTAASPSPTPSSSEETPTATIPSGGSRGGSDSPAMQARIAQAHSRILALYEGKREEQRIIVQEEESDLTAQKREERIKQRIAKREAEIVRLQQEKEDLHRQYAERREERLAKALALQEKRIAEERAALLAEQEELEREQEENRKQRASKIAQQQQEKESSGMSSPKHASLEVIAARRNRLFAMVGDVPVVFADVSTEEWYAPYVSYVVEKNIATGYADENGKPKGEFGVANPITQAELLKMALEAAGKAPDPSAKIAPQNRTARGTWAAPYVKQAEDLGFSVFTKNPDVHAPATRGEVIQTVLEALGFFIPKTPSSFSDVPTSHPYTQAIGLAAYSGFVQGDTAPDGTPLNRFRPDDPINRAEVSKIIALMKEVANQ